MNKSPPKPRYPEPKNTPGVVLVVLVALTTNLVCWFATGIAGYASPSLPIAEDMTLLYVFLWIPQLFTGLMLAIAAVSRGWSTSGATLSAIIVGAGMTYLVGFCWADWGNLATGAFWLAAGIHGAIGVEARFGVVEGVEKRIEVLLNE